MEAFEVLGRKAAALGDPIFGLKVAEGAADLWLLFELAFGIREVLYAMVLNLMPSALNAFMPLSIGNLALLHFGLP